MSEFAFGILSDIAKGKRGVTYKPEDLVLGGEQEHYRLLTAGNIQDGITTTHSYAKVSPRCVSQNQLISPDEILVCMSNGSKRLVGKSSRLRSADSKRYCVGAFCSTFTPNEDADPEFVFQIFQSENFKKHVSDALEGSAINNLKNSTIESFEVPIPPLPEQKRIAEILSGIDRQILSVKSEIQQARKISTAVTKNLLGSIQDETLTLSEVAINHDSIRVPIKSEERALRNGPYRYFGASGIIDSIDDFLFDGDYILIGEDGANIIDRNKPLAFKVSGKFWVNNHAHIIQPRESCNINFLTYYLESLDYTGIASGSAQPKITRSALDAIQVPIPPLEVQKKIGAVIESTIDMATTAEKKEKKLIDLRQALSSDLLSGRKRVSI